MVQLSAWLLRKCPGPPKVWRRLETFRINAKSEGRSRNCFVIGQRRKMKALQYATVARQLKVADTKELYTLRIEAAAEEQGIAFEHFWKALKEMDVQLNRKVLSDIAIYEPRTFASFCELTKQHNVDKGLNIPEHSYPKIPVITKGML
ncbi:large ribosomal subunit protein bL20-like [Watersipora subatra]|uniref:large ribosomal subunit protein bL20-like n=1 Tax=Watersipora subatra TaxID=2589382 RepID=UPI00355C6FD2